MASILALSSCSIWQLTITYTLKEIITYKYTKYNNGGVFLLKYSLQVDFAISEKSHLQLVKLVKKREKKRKTLFSTLTLHAPLNLLTFPFQYKHTAFWV